MGRKLEGGGGEERRGEVGGDGVELLDPEDTDDEEEILGALSILARTCSRPRTRTEVRSS